jgi:hypothetical protein
MTEPSNARPLNWRYFAGFGVTMAVSAGIHRGARDEIGFFGALFVGAVVGTLLGVGVWSLLTKLFPEKKTD